MEQDVLIFFRLEERDAMDFEFTERAAVEGVQQAMQMPAQFFIHAGDELRNLLLRDRGGEIDIPDRQAGKSLGIARKQTMEEGGAASQIPQNEEWFFDRLCFVPGEEDIIQKEKEPMHE